MAAADDEAGVGCLSSEACDDDCASFARLCLDKAGTVAGLTAAERRKEKEKARKDERLKKLRGRRRKANMAVEDHREQGAGCGDDGWVERRQKADMAVEDHREQGPGCGDDGWVDLEHLFFDEATAVAEHERPMQREHWREQEEAHNRKLCRAREAALARIREYDPKDGITYCSRLEYVDDIITFDHDEECKCYFFCGGVSSYFVTHLLDLTILTPYCLLFAIHVSLVYRLI
jgi:hypothetical protein